MIRPELDRRVLAFFSAGLWIERLLDNKGFDKPDFYGIISIDHLLMPTWNTGKIPINDNWIPIKDN